MPSPPRPHGPGLFHREFRVPKRGHRLEECEDASAADPGLGRFAVADGAAESAFGGAWARLLVDGFVRRTLGGPEWPGWIAPLQTRWRDQVTPPQGSPPMPYYLEDRFNQGAFATFLGLEVNGDGWQALAVGDTCLFHVREGKLQLAFPMTRAEDFGNSPWLVGSRSSPDGVPREQCSRVYGDCQPGDCLWLMTDALAQWFLRAHEERRNPAEQLEPFLNGSPEAFIAWVSRLRDEKRLRNDDVTLVGVCI